MATQKGRNWSSGDIVTAANLSSIERGVSAVAEEYTPTTWVNGNTVTAAALNKIEQGIVNAGGGGSSDFSTATVTFDNSAGAQFMLPVILLDLPSGDTSASAIDKVRGEVQAILYKGNAMGVILGGTVTVTGSATYSAPVLVVTGDCTITIS